MGRRAHCPTQVDRRQVETLAGYGVPETQIAGLLSIDPKTLRKHYRSELDHGHTKANAKVAENLFRIATGAGREAVTAAIFWLKTRAGWMDASRGAPGAWSGEQDGEALRVTRIIIAPANMPGEDDDDTGEDDEDPKLIEHDQRERGRTGHG
ncbi:hypothetical protein [Zhengella mangrovi]|uniref:hypothetical protein n=1 Tax=Zhengella mangrovi TaxID=1982044 RepID=UPI00197BF5A1|nr:hypothetical protein [Zhengella mangrovi]